MATRERFYDYLYQKGYEKITIKGYKRTLEKFIKDVGTEKPKKKVAEKYLIEMRKKDYSYSHNRNTTGIIRKYMEFIKKPIEIENPRRPTTLPSKDILTEGEIARMMAACKNVREKAIIGILAYGGLRNREVCNLKVKDVNLDEGYLKVIGGKFKKDRIIPLSKDLFQILVGYLKEYPRNKQWLFTTLVRDNQYTGGDLRKRVKVVANRAGIKKRVYPHLLRHSLITHLLERGANVIAVQQLAGHANLKTTMIYTHFSPRKIRQEYIYYVPSYI